MDYDSSDILAPSARPVVRPSGPALWSKMSVLFQISSVFGIVLVSWWLFVNLKEYFTKWHERSYRLSMRRRHGIPDDDHRPFNVAYAAAVRARNDQEAEERSPQARVRHKPRAIDSHATQLSAESENQKVRRRFVDPTGYSNVATSWTTSDREPAGRMLHADMYRPTVFASTTADSNSYVPKPAMKPHHVNFEDQYNPTHVSSPSHAAQEQVGAPSNGAVPPGRNEHLNGNGSSRKRALDDESESDEMSKRSRVEGEEPIHNEEGLGRDNDNKMDEDSPPKRGSKRVASSEDDELIGGSRKERREKRVRRHTREREDESENEKEKEKPDEEMEDADELMDMVDVPRGKKRDRVEAGSTFGGDDESGEEQEARSQRRRKRRSVQKRKSEVATRGKKRDRDVGSDGENEEEETTETGSERRKVRASRKKRGKKAAPNKGDDVVIDDTPISTDPLCKGRRIGEEWESNGVNYKVGPNGQRLRQALVKKSRTRYAMPVDSRHPDREAHLEVYVETWLSDEEYKAAKERYDLAWQETPQVSRRGSIEPDTPGDVPDSPSKIGKSLLWSSLSGRDSPVPRRDPFRQSVVTNLGLRINPFQQSQLASAGRRIASGYAAPLSTTTPKESPVKTYRSFSKWEKQDLEAEAMARMRRNEEAKQAELKKSSINTAPSVNPPPVSAGANFFNVPKPVDKPATTSETKPTAPPTFGLPASPAEAAKPPSSSPFTVPSTTASKDTNASKPSGTFTWPPATSATPDKEKSTPSPFAPSSGPTASPFSSGTPLVKQQPQAPSTTTPSTGHSIPDFFGQKGISTTPATTAPAAPNASTTVNPFAPTNPSANAGAAQQPTQKPSFSFGVTGGTSSAKPPSPFGFGGQASTTSTPMSDGAQSAQQQKTDESRPPQGSGGMGGSLFGGFGPSSGGSSQAQPSGTAGGGSTFPFGTLPTSTTSQASKPVFGVTSLSGTPAAPASSGMSGGSSPFGAATNEQKLKFKFETPAASRSSAPSPAPMNTEAQQPANPFGTGASNTPATSGNSSANTTGVHKFSFGATSTPGNGMNTASKEAPKSSPFGGGGAFTGAGGGNPFSTTSAASPAAPVFGSTSSFGAFGGNAASSNKTAEPAKSPFDFNSAPSKSTFTFGSLNTSTAGASKPGSTYSFGTTGPSTATSGANPNQSSNPFGGASSMTGAGGLPTPGENKNTFAFNLGSTPSMNTTTNTASPFAMNSQPSSNNAAGSSNTPSVFGNSGNTQPPTNPSAFGFGNPRPPSNSTSNPFNWSKPADNENQNMQ